jgi:ligand-binding sensor domain-containing protein
MKHIVLLVFSFFTFSLIAQVPVGSWRDHLPYSRCKKVVKIGSKLFCATPYNIFTYDTRDNSLQKLSKITGLSDMGISNMEYYPEKNILLIAYDNGNIDLIENQQITNIPIIQKRIMTGSKKANHIFFRGDFAYLSYSFGIIVLDLEKLEIKDTYIVGEKGHAYEVFALVADDQYFYAGTQKGIFKADINDPFLVNYTRWYRDVSIPNDTGKFSLLALFNGKVVANYNGALDNSDTLYYLENNGWVKILAGLHQPKYEIRESGGKLMVCGQFRIFAVNPDNAISTTISDYPFIYPSPNSSLMDEEGNIWIADDQAGLVFNYLKESNFRSIFPNGPVTNNAWKMFYRNGIVYVTAGGTSSAWDNLFIRARIFMYNSDNWTTISDENQFDYISLEVDPVNPQKIYVGAWGQGVVVYENGQKVETYSYTNSSLQSMIPNSPYVRVGGLAFDQDKNLWVTNGGVGSPVSVRKANGEWKSFPWGSYLNDYTLSDIHIDQQGQYWVVMPHGEGLFVFKHNGTIDDEKDDSLKKFKPVSAYGDIISNIYCITGDRDGYVWVGTDHGPVFYSNPQGIFYGETAGTQVTIPRNDGTSNADPLLGSEAINCITVDGANRKWFGTQKGGAFLISPDGMKEIYHFNTDNSPLFSNNVLSIAINDRTGEVFFGTDRGIISYRSNATKPEEDFKDVYVFPNPIREGYSGDIIITGLIENTHVKITDISGNLVYQTKSYGGQAVWNGKTGNGRRVATGVYLVFCSNDDGSKTFITKMLFIH